MEEICDTPAEKLASRDPTDACVEEAWRQSAERERISEIHWNVFQIKNSRQTRFSSSLPAVLKGLRMNGILLHHSIIS
jgi:hypothetical protein